MNLNSKLIVLEETDKKQDNYDDEHISDQEPSNDVIPHNQVEPAIAEKEDSELHKSQAEQSEDKNVVEEESEFEKTQSAESDKAKSKDASKISEQEVVVPKIEEMPVSSTPENKIADDSINYEKPDSERSESINKSIQDQDEAKQESEVQEEKRSQKEIEDQDQTEYFTTYLKFVYFA